MQIKVLGTGCANCKNTLKLIEDTANRQGVNVQLEKVEDLPTIMSYGVMSTPAVVVEGKVVHAGGIPTKEAVEGWLAGAAVTTPVSQGNNSGGCGGGSTSCC